MIESYLPLNLKFSNFLISLVMFAVVFFASNMFYVWISSSNEYFFSRYVFSSFCHYSFSSKIYDVRSLTLKFLADLKIKASVSTTSITLWFSLKYSEIFEDVRCKEFFNMFRFSVVPRYIRICFLSKVTFFAFSFVKTEHWIFSSLAD